MSNTFLRAHASLRKCFDNRALSKKIFVAVVSMPMLPRRSDDGSAGARDNFIRGFFCGIVRIAKSMIEALDDLVLRVLASSTRCSSVCLLRTRKATSSSEHFRVRAAGIRYGR
jgi:hypothetical protein